MVRETSIEAYNYIKDNGILNGLQWQIYDIICNNPDLTIREVAEGFFPNLNDRSISPRYAELEKRNGISRNGKKICPYSGRKVYKWIDTGKIPRSLQKQKRKECKHCNGKGYIEDPQWSLFS